MSFNSHDCETVSMKEAQEQEKNNPVTQIAAAASIAFVVLAEGGQIDDVTATEHVEQFAPGPTRSPTKRAISAATVPTCTGATRTTLRKPTGPPAAAASLWSKIGDRRRNGRNGPSRSAPMTPITPARRCPITEALDVRRRVERLGTWRLRLDGGDGMTEGIIIAVLSMVGTLAGAYLANRKSSALIAYRLDKLEEKVDKHNSVIERTFKLEEQAALIDERIKVANHRIEDLEKAQ